MLDGEVLAKGVLMEEESLLGVGGMRFSGGVSCRSGCPLPLLCVAGGLSCVLRGFRVHGLADFHPDGSRFRCVFRDNLILQPEKDKISKFQNML